MEKEVIQKYKDSKVKITLKNGIFYTGTIIEIYTESFIINDKFNQDVAIDNNSVSSINAMGDAQWK